jgi:hypothetical protein
MCSKGLCSVHKSRSSTGYLCPDSLCLAQSWRRQINSLSTCNFTNQSPPCYYHSLSAGFWATELQQPLGQFSLDLRAHWLYSPAARLGELLASTAFSPDASRWLTNNQAVDINESTQDLVHMADFKST